MNYYHNPYYKIVYDNYIDKKVYDEKEWSIYEKELFDEVIIPDFHTRGGSRVVERYKQMITDSNIVFCYVTDVFGNSYKQLKYAQKLNKRIVYFNH